jgi:signal transduction histidine kinase
VHRRHEVLLDAAVPAVVGAVIVVGELLHGGSSAELATVALGLAAAATLWARRPWPGWTLLASGLLVAVLFHLDRAAGTVAVIAPAVALYSLALRRGRVERLLAGLGAVSAVLVADLLDPGHPGILPTFGHMLLVAIPLLAAERARTHRANLTLLEERLRLAEQAREQEAERRAEQERMRIARELHDVVAHTLTEINVQAAATAERLTPGDARAALEQIEDSSHAAIGEVRAILGVLRETEGAEPPRTPVPGTAEIGELVERARTTGLDVQLEIDGERGDHISDATSLAAYRIVQESLTNARRHAAGASVRVRLSFNAAELALAVDSGQGADSDGTWSAGGAGITGMADRATSLGGSFEAGPTPEGFRVRAELPYRPV